MSFKYWEDKSAAERNLDMKTDTVSDSDACAVATEVQALQEMPSNDQINNVIDFERIKQQKEEEDAAVLEEVERILEGDNVEDASSTKRRGSILKYIFVDGLLGIPFITIVYLLIAVLIAVLFVFAIAITASYIVLFAASVCMLAISFINITTQPPASIFMIGLALLIAAISLLLLLLSLFIWRKVLPATAGLCGKTERGLNLFGLSRRKEDK